MCDTLVSLGNDGVLFAKNSDRDPNEAQVLRWHAAADHEPGTEVACTWISVPQVPHTHGVLLSQPWWMWGAEIGANEHGVVIGNEAGTYRLSSILASPPTGSHLWGSPVLSRLRSCPILVLPQARQVALSANIGYRFYANHLHQFYTCDWPIQTLPALPTLRPAAAPQHTTVCG